MPGASTRTSSSAEADAVMLARACWGTRTGEAFGIAAGSISAGRIASGTELMGCSCHGPRGAAPSAVPRHRSSCATRASPATRIGRRCRSSRARSTGRATRVDARISRRPQRRLPAQRGAAAVGRRARRRLRTSPARSSAAQEALAVAARVARELGRYAPGPRGIDLRARRCSISTSRRARSARSAAARCASTAVLDGTQLHAVAGLPPIEVLHGTLAFADGHLQRSSLTGPVARRPGEPQRRRSAASAARTAVAAARAARCTRRRWRAAAERMPRRLRTGNAEWSAQLEHPAGQPTRGRGELALRADSSLVGVASSLPEPLAKAAEAVLPLHVELHGRGRAARSCTSRSASGCGHCAAARAQRRQLAHRARRAASRQPSARRCRPMPRVRAVEGRIGRLDLPGYLPLWRAARADAPRCRRCRRDLTAGELLLGGRACFPECACRRSRRRGAGSSKLAVRADISGAVRWPGAADAQQPRAWSLARLRCRAGRATSRWPRAWPQRLAPGRAWRSMTCAGRAAPSGRFSAPSSARPARWRRAMLRLAARQRQLRAARPVRGDGACSATLQPRQHRCRSRRWLARAAADLDARRGNLSGELRLAAAGAAAPLATLQRQPPYAADRGRTRRCPGRPRRRPFAAVRGAGAAGLDRAGRWRARRQLRFARLAADFELRDGVASTATCTWTGMPRSWCAPAWDSWPATTTAGLRAAGRGAAAGGPARARPDAEGGGPVAVAAGLARRRGRRTQPRTGCVCGARWDDPIVSGAMTRGRIMTHEASGPADDFRTRGRRESRSRRARCSRQAAARGARLAALPENFSFMGLKDADKRAVAEADGAGPVQDFLARTAGALGLWIIGGTVPLRAGADGRVAAASLVYDADGAARRRATTRSTCSTSTSRSAPRATASPRTSPRARGRWSSTRRSAGSACRCATTCASRSCTGSLSAAGAQLLAVPSAFTAPDRARALGDAAARAGDRESLLRDRAGAVGLPSRAAARPTATA